MNTLYRPSEWGLLYHTIEGVDELLGAGSAGPGKSMVLLMDPIFQLVVEHERCSNKRHPHHLPMGSSTGWALHLRREYQMLKQTMDRAARIFPSIDPGARFDSEARMWVFSCGYKYQFAHCKDPNDWEAFMSNQYCCARGTLVVMWNGTEKPIEEICAGDSVMTLEGPRLVTEAFRAGVKPCVEMTIEYRGETVGRQLHPTTHPVLAWPTDESTASRSLDSLGSVRRARPNGLAWQDYESLLCGRQESQARRASSIVYRNGSAGSDGGRLENPQLPPLSVQIALHGQTVRKALNCARSTESCEMSKRTELFRSIRRAGRQRSPLSLAGLTQGLSGGQGILGYADRIPVVCGESDALTGPEKLSGCPGRCFVCSGPRDGQFRSEEESARAHVQRPDDAASRSPTCYDEDAPASTRTGTPCTRSFYPHFYSGSERALTEEVLRGEGTMRFAGWFETFDLTVEGANHYITSNGSIQAQSWIGFDELVQFEEEQYDQIAGRLRSSDPVLCKMLKVRSMSNPLMRREEGQTSIVKDPFWVRRRFVDPHREGKVKLTRVLKRANGSLEKYTLMYLPAKLSDNPDKEFVKSYEKTLLSKKAHIRRALLDGDWYVTAGAFFGEDWASNVHICRPFAIPPDWPQFRSMDWGYKSPGAIYWCALDPDDTLIFHRELSFQGKTATEMAKRIREIDEDLGLWQGRYSRITGPADTQLWEQRGESGLSKAAEMSAKGITWARADKKSRQRNAERLLGRLKSHEAGANAPGILFFENCKMAIQTIPSMPTSITNPEEPMDGGDDHWADAVMYACAYASRGRAGVAMVPDDKEDWEEDVVRDRLGGKPSRFGYGFRT